MTEKYEYKILNYWNDQDNLYVNYVVENLKTNEIANVIDYYNISDIGCDYNKESEEVIKKSLYKLIEKNNGIEFNIPKVSRLGTLLKYVYDCVCESESNMCHIDNFEWEELKEDYGFTDEDINTLNKEIVKYNLENYITTNSDGYKICGYGGLQSCFNDDRKKIEQYER